MNKNENIIQTRGRHTSEWGKKGYETSVIGRQERGKSTKYDIFHKLLRSVFLKQFPTNSKSTIIISRKTDVSLGTHMCLNKTYRKVHVYLYVCQRRVI